MPETAHTAIAVVGMTGESSRSKSLRMRQDRVGDRAVNASPLTQNGQLQKADDCQESENRHWVACRRAAMHKLGRQSLIGCTGTGELRVDPPLRAAYGALGRSLFRRIRNRHKIATLISCGFKRRMPSRLFTAEE